MSDFHHQSLVDTVDALRSGHLPAVTLARQMLRRIQSAESLAAYVSVDSEGVLARAAALSQKRSVRAAETRSRAQPAQTRRAPRTRARAPQRGQTTSHGCASEAPRP